MGKPLLLTFFFVLFAPLLYASADSSLVFEVYFPLDQHQLPAKEKEKVDSILAKVPFSIVKRLVIYGHTDSLAGVEYNRRLSKNRVLSILQYFVLKGLDPRKAKTDYYGEERPKYDNGPDERFKNRRCEVQLDIDASLIPKPEQKLSDLNLSKGDKLRIPNLVFVGNQPIPIWESMPALQDLSRLMKRNPDLKIEIQGHVCCADDQQLSTQRAFTVYSYLLANGIEKSRMRYTGFSNSKPLFPETSRENRALNRRVEFEVLSNSALREPLAQNTEVLDIRAQVLNLKFFENSARLMPSGDFMLGLIAEMIADSEGLFYAFTVYNNLNDANLTKQRALALEKLIRRKGVKADQYSVENADAPKGMPPGINENYVIVQIRSKS